MYPLSIIDTNTKYSKSNLRSDLKLIIKPMYSAISSHSDPSENQTEETFVDFIFVNFKKIDKIPLRIHIN